MKILSKLFGIGVVVIVLTLANQVSTSPTTKSKNSKTILLTTKDIKPLEGENTPSTTDEDNKRNSAINHKKKPNVEVERVIIKTDKKNKNIKKKGKNKEKKKKYTEEEYELLAKVIYGEAGIFSDKLQLYVGSVVLNRVKDSRFPNTLEEVVFQPRQYGCTKSRRWKSKPNESAYKNAKILLEEGSKLPDYVIFQAEFKQGDSVYENFENTYFCYYKKDSEK